MNKKLLLVLIGMFQVASVLGHNMFCLTSSMIPSPEPQQLKCFYHYVYHTRDGRTCYIQFTLGNGVTLVPQSTLGYDSLAVRDLGSMAIKADIFGVEDKHPEKLKKDGWKAPSAGELQVEGFKGFTRFTMNNQGIPLAVKFEPEAMPMVNVARLFNRDNVPGNMALDQLQSIIGLGRVADDLPDLIHKVKDLKINGCSVTMPSK